MTILPNTEMNEILTCCSAKMVKLSSVDRARAIGHVDAGWNQRDVAVLFGVSQSTISKLRLRYRDTHDVQDRPRSGRPRVTTDRVDRSIRLATLRNRRIAARSLQISDVMAGGCLYIPSGTGYMIPATGYMSR